jgi:hypothetical protein
MRERLMNSKRMAVLISVVIGVMTPLRALHAQAACPWPGPPQFLTDRPSLPDSTLVPTGSTPIKICYSRPSARGRNIFGDLVPFGRPWRTGANEPTMLHLPITAIVGGVRLEPGTYIVLSIPTSDSWTLLFNTSSVAEPLEMFSALTEVGRAELPIERIAEHVETLTIRDSDQPGELAFVIEWEHTRVRVPIELES